MSEGSYPTHCTGRKAMMRYQVIVTPPGGVPETMNLTINDVENAAAVAMNPDILAQELTKFFANPPKGFKIPPGSTIVFQPISF